MKKRAVINMKDLNIKGNVIDVATKGNTIVSEIAATMLMEDKMQPDKDFISWGGKSIPSDENTYDYAIAFFSLSKLGNKFKLGKILRELKRVLKKEGKIFIWDAYGIGIKLNVCYELKVLISEGDIRRVNYRIKFNPFRVSFNGVMKALKKNGFLVQNSRVLDNIYYLEALNMNERK